MHVVDLVKLAFNIFLGQNAIKRYSSPFHKNSYDKNCRKCKTKIKKSFTKILTTTLSVKIVLTLRVRLS